MRVGIPSRNGVPMVEAKQNALSLLSSGSVSEGADRRIADFILSHLDEATDITLAALAKRSETSEATVSRFCKHLGFGSYRSFQYSLARGLMTQGAADESANTGEVSTANVGRSLQNILATKKSALDETIEAIDERSLLAVIDLLASANIIEIAAVGNTIPVAMDAAFKFNQLGLRCVTNDIHEKLMAMALTLTPRDAIIIISNSGKSRRLNLIAETACRQRVPLVVITGNLETQLARSATHVFRAVSHERLLTTGDYTFSKISSTLIIEVLYNFLLSILPNARESIGRHEDLIAFDKTVD